MIWIAEEVLHMGLWGASVFLKKELIHLKEAPKLKTFRIPYYLRHILMKYAIKLLFIPLFKTIIFKFLLSFLFHRRERWKRFITAFILREAIIWTVLIRVNDIILLKNTSKLLFADNIWNVTHCGAVYICYNYERDELSSRTC